jgi:hypothetical protein
LLFHILMQWNSLDVVSYNTNLLLGFY